MSGKDARQAAHTCPDAARCEDIAELTQEGLRVLFVGPKDQRGLRVQALQVPVVAHGRAVHRFDHGDHTLTQIDR